jgi:hypothetical protein
MPKDVVQSFLHYYYFMTRNKLIADSHAITLMAATD